MYKFLMLLSVAALVTSTTGCGCCRCFRPAAPTVSPRRRRPPARPVAADPCTVPTTTSYGYPPASYPPASYPPASYAPAGYAPPTSM